MSKKIIKNIKYMGIMQIANYALPVIYIPIISRVIGPEKFGILNYINTVIGYFIVFISFGFDYTAVRKIAADPENQNLLNKTFSRVFSAQLFLSGIVLIVIVISANCIDNFYQNREVYYYSALVCIATLLSQNWILQAKQQFSKVAILTVISKLILMILLIFFVSKEADYKIVPFLTSIVSISGAIASFCWIYFKNKIIFKFDNFEGIFTTLKESYLICMSQFMIGLYNNFNIIYLGLFQSALFVGYYTSGQKLIGIMQMIVSLPINLTLYPVFANKFAKSKEEGKLFLQQITPVFILLLIIASIINCIIAPITISILYGPKFIDSVLVLQLLSFIPLLSFFNNLFGVNVLLNLKLDKKFLRITALAGVVGVSVNLLLFHSFSYLSAAIAWNIAEIFSFTFILRELIREGLNPFSVHFFKLTQLKMSINKITGKTF